MESEIVAAALWVLLDDIDTLDDACRSDDAMFRKLVRQVQRRRFHVLSDPSDDLIRKGRAFLATLPKDAV